MGRREVHILEITNHTPWRRGLLAASLLSCAVGCGGSQATDNPWAWPAIAPRDTIVARVDVAPGTRVRAWMLDDKWRSGIVTGIANDTLHLADGPPGVPLLGLRELQVNTGERVRSGGKMFLVGLVGFFLGGLGGAEVATLVDPCPPSTGNPDADICLDPVAYVSVGAAVGTALGLWIGSLKVDRWVTVFPEKKDHAARCGDPPRFTMVRPTAAPLRR